LSFHTSVCKNGQKIVKNNFPGDKKGAGLKEFKNGISYLSSYTYRFDPADSKAVAGTMDGIRRWAASHPSDPVNK
jgi:hypothetical protein